MRTAHFYAEWKTQHSLWKIYRNFWSNGWRNNHRRKLYQVYLSDLRISFLKGSLALAQKSRFWHELLKASRDTTHNKTNSRKFLNPQNKKACIHLLKAFPIVLFISLVIYTCRYNGCHISHGVRNLKYVYIDTQHGNPQSYICKSTCFWIRRISKSITTLEKIQNDM